MRINERESYFWYWRIRNSFIFLSKKRVSDLKRQREIISFGGYGIMKEVRSRRKRNYEEPDACHLIS
jgi:hypothetical protein